MDCKEAEQLFATYVFGALDSRRRTALDHHADTCAQCASRQREDGDVLADLAYVVPQLVVPRYVKQRLLSRIDQEAGHQGRID
jgi:hypothetical protein